MSAFLFVPFCLLLGMAAGGLGTLIGAGGGFLLTPVLLICFPTMSAETVTTISMIAIFCNSLSGSFAYTRMKRVDYKTGVIFAVATIPGAIMGTLLTMVVSRDSFNIIFGAFLVLFSVVIVLKNRQGHKSAPPEQKGLFRAVRHLADKDGNKADFSFNMLAGIIASVFAGFLSGLLGIGGGIVHVPVLVFLGFPAHFATATSHFVLMFSSLTSVIVHLENWLAAKDVVMSVLIAVGVIIGAQIGARVSQRINGKAIMYCLAAALLIAGARILCMGIL